MPVKNKSRVLMFRVTEATGRAVDRAAAAANQRRSKWLRRLVEKAVVSKENS